MALTDEQIKQLAEENAGAGVAGGASYQDPVGGFFSRVASSVRDFAADMYDDPVGFAKQYVAHFPEGAARGVDSLEGMLNVLAGSEAGMQPQKPPFEPGAREFMERRGFYKGEGEYETPGERAGAEAGFGSGQVLPYAGGAVALGARSPLALATEAAGVLGTGAGRAIGAGAAPPGATPEEIERYRLGGETALGVVSPLVPGVAKDVGKAVKRKLGYARPEIVEHHAARVMQANTGDIPTSVLAQRDAEAGLKGAATLRPGQAAEDSGMMTQELSLAKGDPQLQSKFEKMERQVEGVVDRRISSEYPYTQSDPGDVSEGLAARRQQAFERAREIGSEKYQKHASRWKATQLKTSGLKLGMKQRLAKIGGEGYFETKGIKGSMASDVAQQIIDMPDAVSAMYLIDRRQAVRALLRERDLNPKQAKILRNVEGALSSFLRRKSLRVPFIRQADEFWANMRHAFDSGDLEKIATERAEDLGRRYFKAGTGTGARVSRDRFIREVKFMRRSGQGDLADEQMLAAQEYLVADAYSTAGKGEIPKSKALREWGRKHEHLREAFPEVFDQLDRIEDLAGLAEKTRLRPKLTTRAEIEGPQFTSPRAQKAYEALGFETDIGVARIPVSGVRATLRWLFTTMNPGQVKEVLKKAALDPSYTVKLQTMDLSKMPQGLSQMGVIERNLKRLPKGASVHAINEALFGSPEQTQEPIQ